MIHLRRILVCGYYGFANTGDEAILAALLSDLRAVHPEAEITVMSGRPSATRGDHGVEAVHWQDVAQMITAATGADLMVLGGGGLFQDHHGFDEKHVLTPDHGTIGYYSGFALLARLTETPLVIYGVGVGPLNTEVGRRWTRIAFQHAAAASVRDEESRDLLVRIGVEVSRIEVTADAAWIVPVTDGETSASILALEEVPDAPKTIIISVRPWGDYTWAESLAAALDRLVSDLDARVLFVPFQDSHRPHENDPNASVEVLKHMKRSDRAAIIRGGYSVEERAALIASSDLMVAMRLHAAIIGLVAAVPTIAIAYDPKVTVAMADVGRPDLSTPLDELTSDFIVTAAKTAIDLGPSPTVADLQERAAGNRSVLDRLGSLPDLTTEAVAAIGKLALGRGEAVTQRGEAVTQARRLQFENTQLLQQHEYDQMAYDNLEEQRQELVNTKAMRAVNAYWQAREGLRTAVSEVGKRAPESIRPMLKKLVGGYQEGMKPPEEPTTADPEAVRAAEEQVREVLERHLNAAGVVVYPPSIGWNVSLFQRPQQMALAFAKLGYLVFYGVDAREAIGEGIEQRADGVYLYPVSWAMFEAMRQLTDPITLSYVYNFSWTKKLSDPRVVFEHIDELEVFTTTHTIEDLRDWYEEAIEGAEVVVGSARDLLEAVRPRRPDAFLCPNGVDYRHFADYAEEEPPEDIADIAGGDRPIIGYYGALAEWVDYPLIRKSATEMSDFEFVFIGPDYDGSIREHTEVFGLPNVRWLGVKEYGELPGYLHHFDVATIPFMVNEVTHSVSPVKLFEYMAGGRPVVTPNLRECAQYEAVQVADDADDYVAKLRHAALELRHDPDHQGLLKQTARANTWEVRVGTLIDALARSGRL